MKLLKHLNLLKVEKIVLKVLGDKKIPIVLGGEHSVSVGAFNAMKEVHKNVSILHLDAHSDLRETYDGTKFSHACVMARAKEKKIPFVSVGIRSLSDEEAGEIMSEKLKVFWAHEIMSDDYWIEDVLENLTQDVYVTLDLDVFDPSIMPATGTPEPGGLDWYKITNLLKKVFEHKNIVGFDIVELAPIEGLSHPDFTVAKLLYRMIGMLK